MPDNDNSLVERPQGVLTKKERKQLLGLLDDENAQTARQRRYRVRQRLRHALIDFQILADAYDDLDLDKAIQPYEGDTDPRDGYDTQMTISEAYEEAIDQDLEDGIEGVFEVLFRALGRCDKPQDSLFSRRLSSGVSTAIDRMYLRKEWVPIRTRVGFDIAIDYSVPRSRVKLDYEEGKPQLISELRHLHAAGEITEEEYDQTIEEHGDIPNRELREQRNQELADTIGVREGAISCRSRPDRDRDADRESAQEFFDRTADEE